MLEPPSSGPPPQLPAPASPRALMVRLAALFCATLSIWRGVWCRRSTSPPIQSPTYTDALSRPGGLAYQLAVNEERCTIHCNRDDCCVRRRKRRDRARNNLRAVGHQRRVCRTIWPRADLSQFLRHPHRAQPCSISGGVPSRGRRHSPRRSGRGAPQRARYIQSHRHGRLHRTSQARGHSSTAHDRPRRKRHGSLRGQVQSEGGSAAQASLNPPIRNGSARSARRSCLADSAWPSIDAPLRQKAPSGRLAV